MSKEMIIRMMSSKEDIELAHKDNFGNMLFKKITSEEFVKMVNTLFNKGKAQQKKDITIFDENIIGKDEYHTLIKQPGHKKIVSYVDSEKELKTYKINFPNCLYVIEHDLELTKIFGIECYAYKEFKGENTQLFEYPMPNELSQNKMCIGSADRAIKKGKVNEALERIIFTPYSHCSFSGMNGFSQTEVYFEYLENNEFPYKMMKSLKKKLRDVLHG